ncbi:major histocompatibility complex class I-related gene protein-like [Mugil cephalus]|uniref:major histocompatibility complex class I-related gene protein-like n=1 Tax=Mugil cephalus TaxID=48193 RepID=UPI001FB789E1|nr:major histocompatibility complex class I-related gene protein-like [Mugil cephalus]
MKKLVFLLLLCHVSSSVKHTLKTYITASAGLTNLPEYFSEIVVDDIQVIYCERSNETLELKQDWMKKVFDDDPEQLNFYNERCFSVCPFLFQSWISSLKERFNQSDGVHILQVMKGCEWDDETGQVTGFWQYGYNGEHLISFDVKAGTWIIPEPQPVFTKIKWNPGTTRIKYNMWFLTEMFPKLLKTYVEYGNTTLMRKDVPSVSLLQKTPSSPVSCHATGFYPDRAMMFWRKDGEEIHEGVEHGEILPNHDGSFQMNVDLDISSVSPEDWRRYDCVFHLSGVEDDIITELDEIQIRTNWEKSSNQTPATTIIISAVVVVVVVVFAAAAGFMVHRKKQDQKAPSDLTDSEETLSYERLDPGT